MLPSKAAAASSKNGGSHPRSVTGFQKVMMLGVFVINPIAGFLKGLCFLFNLENLLKSDFSLTSRTFI